MRFTPAARGLLLAFLSAALLSGCRFVKPPIQGSGVSKTETRPVGAFTEVEVSGTVHLDLAVGPAISLEVTTDDNLLPHVITEVSGGRLKISLDGATSTNLGIHVKATTPALTAFEGSGATTSTLTGIRGQEFRLNVSGASTCNLKGKADHFDVKISGASNCTLGGEAERLTAECSGASRIDATGLSTRVVQATASGASTADVGAVHDLTAEASGASTIHYAGRPANLKTNASGASSIKRR